MIANAIKKIKTLGFKGLSRRLYDASSKNLFHFKWRNKAEKNQANHTWKHIKGKHSLENFTSTLTHIATDDIVKTIRSSKQFKAVTPQNKPANIVHCADQLANNQFDILGSGLIQLPDILPWQSDIKLPINKQQNLKTVYFADITIDTQQTNTLHDYNFDIKMPWELSRMHHVYTLGRAYEISNNPKYTHTIVSHIDSWITHNKFLLGINWVSPMEVAIRAINIMWGMHFLHTDKTISDEWWQKVIASLYDHVIYLKSNMLHATRPNNHFLAELLGYAYLCHFFSFIPLYKKELLKTCTMLNQQFDLQIQLDNTSYEGSTSYHKLDTELYLHAQFLGCISNKLEGMITFLQDCSDKENNVIQIGDNDSARLVTGLQFNKPSAHNKTITYKDFGLSIIKHEDWHITFRHPTYQSQQPSGHFHHDQLSVTVSIAGIPILIDPGSYLYTANHKARNVFRSFKSHNTFTSSNLDEQQFFTELFQLPRPERNDCSGITTEKNNIIIQDSYVLNQTFNRKLIFDTQKKRLTLYDTITPKEATSCRWTLNFAPEIALQYNALTTSWDILFQQSPIAKLHTTTPFSRAQNLYSARYGTKQLCTTLIGQTFDSSDPIVIKLTQV